MTNKRSVIQELLLNGGAASPRRHRLCLHRPTSDHLDARQLVLTSLALIDGNSAAMLLQSHTSIHPDDVPTAQLLKAMYADG